MTKEKLEFTHPLLISGNFGLLAGVFLALLACVPAIIFAILRIDSAVAAVTNARPAPGLAAPARRGV